MNGYLKIGRLSDQKIFDSACKLSVDYLQDLMAEEGAPKRRLRLLPMMQEYLNTGILILQGHRMSLCVISIDFGTARGTDRAT